MQKIILLFLFPIILSIGQVIDFDDASKWTQGSGPFDSYQNDHKYNDQINGYDVEFTGDIVLRETNGTEDGYPKTHNNSAYSWRLKEGAASNFTATVNATQISGFSFFMRQQDGEPNPKYIVELLTQSDSPGYWEVIAILDSANFFGDNSDWKQYINSQPLTVPDSIGYISFRVTPWGFLGPVDGVLIDDFAFDNPLPVELTTFTASIVDKNVELNWETATEVNNYGFEIERQYQESSVKLQEWEKISFVEGHGNSNSPKYYSYTDNTLGTSGKYVYRLKQIDIDGTYEYSEEVEIIIGAPEEFELSQNYPNPFNPTTTIKYSVPLLDGLHATSQLVQLNVYDILGREVVTLVSKQQNPGNYQVTFNAKELNAGIYFYKLATNNYTQIRKMILLK